MKLTFDRYEAFDERDPNSPCIHIAQLNVDVEGNSRCYVHTADGRRPINGYRIRLARKVVGIDRDYPDDRERFLCRPNLRVDHFLFDVHFNRHRIDAPPGQNILFWSQFCLYTYHLLRYRRYELFETLVDQFLEFVHGEQQILRRADLNDFFQSCLKYSPYALARNPESHRADRVIFLMIGFLNVTNTNLALDYAPVRQFSQSLVEDLNQHHEKVFQLVTDKDWPHFCNGLSVFLAIQLVTNPAKLINIVQRISHIEHRGELANLLIRRLEQLNRSVISADWISLFTLVDPQTITLRQLELTRSIEIYLLASIAVLQRNLPERNFTDEDFAVRFDQLIYEDLLIVDLPSTLVMLKSLDYEKQEKDEAAKKILHTVHRALEESMTLRAKVKNCLYSIGITEKQFDEIRFILSMIGKTDVLYLVDKARLLNHLLKNLQIPPSAELYKKWFFTFLIFDEPFSETKKREFQDVLNAWAKAFALNHQFFVQIVRDLDALLNAFGQRQHYQTLFIQLMLDLCLRQTHFFRVIEEGLVFVHHETFLKPFKKRFAERNSTILPEKFKQLTNSENPLHHLLKLHRQTRGENQLINDLIRLSSEKIQLTGFEILHDTFDRPTPRTFVYTVLFDPAFEASKLRRTIIDQLLAMWDDWEEQGFRATQIARWKGFNAEERQTVQRIWNFIGEIAKRQFEIDALVNSQQHELDKKIQIKNQLNLCLDRYCQHAEDRKMYQTILDEIDAKLKSETLRFIKIPKELENLLPLAQLLNPLDRLYAWRIFFAEHRSEGSRNPVTTDDDALLDNRPNFREDDLPADTRPCLVILQDAVRILELFRARWKEIGEEWRDAPISNLLQMFPEKKFIDEDLKLLRQFDSSTAIDHLRWILDYWKDRETINRICRGWMHLLDADDQAKEKLEKISQMNEKTRGLDCSIRSQFFIEQIRTKYSPNLLKFLAQYDICHDLILFLNTLTLADVDNLLHAVNDWDETLINTKTVLDFVLLKRFLVQLNENLQQDAPSSFARISNAFEQTFRDAQYANFLAAFPVCSASLTAMKRIHLELTDKESAKRKRISDLMRQMTFSFVKEASNQFDIQFETFVMKFADLSELQDRARLMEHSIKNNVNHRPTDAQQSKELAEFVRFVDLVEKVLKNLGLLNLSGHPALAQFLAPQKIFICEQSRYDELVAFSLLLDNLFYDWQISLCQMYVKHLDLTHFLYQQIWTIEDLLYNRLDEQMKTHPGYHLLKFIDIQPETIRSDLLPPRPNEPTERLATIGKILSAQRRTSTDETKTSSKKIFLVETSDQGTLRAILSLFDKTNVDPSVNRIFYCSNETSWTEIRAFIYRCFFSQKFHQLIRPENLSASIQDNFTRLLLKLIDEHPQHLFQLAVITNISNTQLQLINGLRSSQLVQLVHDQEMLSQADLLELIRKKIGTKAALVTSRIDGLGKSYFIRNEVKRNGENYIKFPIHGEIPIDEIAERLQNLSNALTSAKVALHIDIGAMSQTQQFNEFLYCLLLFRRFRFGQIAVDLPADVSIYVELDASPSYAAFYDRILVFKAMKTKRFEHIDWNDFDLFDPPAIQFVVNYLLAVQDNSILKRDITPENMNKYDRTQCLNVLKAMFPAENHPDFTWIQLSIFISIYHCLFTGFSHCGYFLVGSLPQPLLRKDLLSELLKSVHQFTSLSVDNVRKNQRAVHIQDATHVFSEAIVRWDKSQPFTLVFSASANPIFVYKQPSDVPQTLVLTFRDHLERSTGKKDQPLTEFFPDYGQFTHQDFFKRLASLSNKFLNKSICLKCFRQHDYAEKQCHVCQGSSALHRPISFKQSHVEQFQKDIADRIETEYVFTPDNFIKMLLIYLRVQSRIPVLIMGETGCGKTALIQCLCQKILDDEMVVFRIHAGVTSDDIIANFARLFRPGGSLSRVRQTPLGFSRRIQHDAEHRPDQRNHLRTNAARPAVALEPRSARRVQPAATQEGENRFGQNARRHQKGPLRNAAAEGKRRRLAPLHRRADSRDDVGIRLGLRLSRQSHRGEIHSNDVEHVRSAA